MTDQMTREHPNRTLPDRTALALVLLPCAIHVHIAYARTVHYEYVFLLCCVRAVIQISEIVLYSKTVYKCPVAELESEYALRIYALRNDTKRNDTIRALFSLLSFFCFCFFFSSASAIRCSRT